MAKHVPTTSWMVHRLGKYPNLEVRTEDPYDLRVIFWPKQGQQGEGWILTRHDARMLARRILQWLEGTK